MGGDVQVEVQVENAGVEQVLAADYYSSLDQKEVRIVIDDPKPGVSEEMGGMMLTICVQWSWGAKFIAIRVYCSTPELYYSRTILEAASAS